MLWFLAALTLAPAPDPRVEWRTYPVDGYTLYDPSDVCKQGLTLPAGAYIVIPVMVTTPDPEKEKRKS